MKKNVIIFYPKSFPGNDKGRIPYALLYLERMIRDLDINIILIDEQIEKKYIPGIEKIEGEIILAGVSAMTGYQIEGGIIFSNYIRYARPETLILWGGWHPSLMPEETIVENFIDFTIIGQGEIPFRNFVISLLEKKDYKKIPGLVYKESGKIIINPPDKFTNFNTFPRINLSLIDVGKFVYSSVHSDRTLGYIATHGCPFNCAFCSVAVTHNRKWFHKEIPEIIEDIKYLQSVANVDGIIFDDDNFFVNRTFAMDLAKELLPLNITWDTSAHAADFLKKFTEEDVAFLYKAGCRQIYIGAESGSQEILDIIAKHATVEDNFNFVKLLNRHKISPLLSTIINFPYKPEEDMNATIEMLRKIKLICPTVRARLLFYTPYPGTALYETAIKSGFIPPKDLQGWSKHTLRKIKSPWTKEEYKWKLEIFANFYLLMSDPHFYQIVPLKFKGIAFVLNKIFYPIVIWRFKKNNFKYPLEAKLFLQSLRLFNKIFGTKISLSFESYIN